MKPGYPTFVMSNVISAQVLDETEAAQKRPPDAAEPPARAKNKGEN
jgi:hypothetical protein